MGGKHPFIKVISLPCPFNLNAISFMEVLAFEYALQSVS